MNTFLEQAYLRTTYEVYAQKKIYALKIQQKNELFQSFCKKQGIKKWAVITAYNPYSEEYSEEENQMNNQRLKKILLEAGCKVLDADGVPENTDWESEKSYFIYNISLELAKKIGITFRQNAIVYGTEDTLAQLVWLV